MAMKEHKLQRCYTSCTWCIPAEHACEAGPGKLNSHAKNKHEAHDRQEVVVEPLEEDPDRGRDGEDARGDLLVPPQQHVGGCDRSVHKQE